MRQAVAVPDLRRWTELAMAAFDRRNEHNGLMDALTLFGLVAVALMLITYACEERSPWFVLGFAVACALGSVYGFLQGAWPFGVVEAIWSTACAISEADADCSSATAARSEMMAMIFRTAPIPCRRSFIERFESDTVS